MMRDVAILGVGRTPVREHWELSVRDLLQTAGRMAMDDCGRACCNTSYKRGLAKLWANAIYPASSVGG